MIASSTIPAPANRNLPLSKRILDVAVASLALAALSPVMLAAALAIKLTSPGPVLFRQIRVGQAERPFAMLKLRTMHVGGDDSAHRELNKKEMLGDMSARAGDGIFKLQDTDSDRLANPEPFGLVRLDGSRRPAFETYRIAAQYLAGAHNAVRERWNEVGQIRLDQGDFTTTMLFARLPLPQQAQVSGAMAEFMTDTPMYQAYVEIAPRPEDFPRLLDRMGELMRESYDWAEEVQTLRMPTMLIFGDSDMFRLEHVVSFYQLLGGGLRDAGWQREHMSPNRLAILPDCTHYDIIDTPLVATTALPFLNTASTAESRAEMVQEA